MQYSTIALQFRHKRAISTKNPYFLKFAYFVLLIIKKQQTGLRTHAKIIIFAHQEPNKTNCKWNSIERP